MGGFELTVVAVDEKGTTLGISGERKGYRAAPFNGVYHQPPVMPLDDSATLALKNLLHKDYVNYWMEHQAPDPEYNLYRYPAKIMGALVIGAVTQARLTSGTEEAKRSEKLGRIVADYMLSIRFPEGSAYENMVPTYHGVHIKEKPPKAHMIAANHMIPMGVDAGNAFLDLYDLTGETKYLDAAKRIGENYVETQNDEGTWPLFADFQSGKAIKDVDTIPTAMINYFDRLRRDYKMPGLEEATTKALDYVMDNPVRSFEWHGQFEDVAPRADYGNLSREQACELAMYLFRNKEEQALAEDLVRFSEDQFVIWEQPRPMPPVKGMGAKGKKSDTWITPSVQEQYVFWYPVGRAAGVMIETYKEAYLATGNEMYMAKARSISNSFPAVQKIQNGDYTTFFTKYSWNFWLNSVVYPAKVLMNLENDE